MFVGLLTDSRGVQGIMVDTSKDMTDIKKLGTCSLPRVIFLVPGIQILGVRFVIVLPFV